MNAFACIRRDTLLPGFFLACLAWAALAAAHAGAQEACLKGCAYPGYPGMAFTLGDGFVAKGGEVKVTHMGFLGQVYNNDGITPRKVGVPNYIGELSFLDPTTGEDKFLFRNQRDWVTHANDSGTVISLGAFPKGAPIVFKYVNVDGKETSYKTFARYSGDNTAGAYDFSADPVLKNLFINGKPKPVSAGIWNWEGHDYNKWAVAASVPGTDQKQFHFEDADDRIFNDIVFRVSGVALTSESFQLQSPSITGAANPDGSRRIAIANAADAVTAGSRIFYTTDGSAPAADSLGNPTGTTMEYLGPFNLAKTATVRAIAWKQTVDNSGNITRYIPSQPAIQTFTITLLQWSKPTATPPGGENPGTLQVALAQAEGAGIHYRVCDPGAACPDPTASDAAYASPISITGAKVIKAIAIQAPRENSETSAFTFAPSYRVLDAVYLDRNGDGRIDAARIAMSGPPATLPASVSLEDPFAPGKRRDVGGAGLHWDAAAPGTLSADFAADPFKAGTGFAAGPFGAFGIGEGFPAGAFSVRDGAGPIIVSAEAEVSLDGDGLHRLTVTFSEPLSDSSGAFPYSVKRGSGSLDGGLQVSQVERLGGNAIRYTFSSGVFPVPGDSVKATAQAGDRAGNPSAMPGYVEIKGKPVTVSARLQVSGGGCMRGGALPDARPLEIPLSVIVPQAAGPVGACMEALETPACLDCLSQEWKQRDPGRPDAAAMPAGPEIRVTTRWPFTFNLAYFNTLGEFVNRAQGEVTAKMLEGVRADAKGEKTVGLRWYPVSESGSQAATGAYVVKGTVSTKPGIDKESVPGVPVVVPPTTQKVLVRFGYLR